MCNILERKLGGDPIKFEQRVQAFIDEFYSDILYKIGYIDLAN